MRRLLLGVWLLLVCRMLRLLLMCHMLRLLLSFAAAAGLCVPYAVAVGQQVSDVGTVVGAAVSVATGPCAAGDAAAVNV